MPTHPHLGHAGACPWNSAFLPHSCGWQETLVTNCTSACGLFTQRRRQWPWSPGGKAGVVGHPTHPSPRSIKALWLPCPPHAPKQAEVGGHQQPGAGDSHCRGWSWCSAGNHTEGRVCGKWQCTQVPGHVSAAPGYEGWVPGLGTVARSPPAPCLLGVVAPVMGGGQLVGLTHI